MKIPFSEYHNSRFIAVTEYIEKAIEILGLRNLRQSIIKNFKYLAWVKNLLQHIQKLLRLQDVVIVYAKKKEDI